MLTVREQKNQTKFRKSLWTDRSGVAAVEFAIIVVPLVFIVLSMIDLGLAYREKIRLGSVLHSAAIYAVQHGSDLSSENVNDLKSEIKTVIQNTAGGSAVPSVEVRVNNSDVADDANAFYCVSGYPPVYIKANSSNEACGDGVTAGKFVTIHITSQSSPILLPGAPLESLIGVAQSVTVRV